MKLILQWKLFLTVKAVLPNYENVVAAPGETQNGTSNLRFGCRRERDVASLTQRRLSALSGKILQPQRKMSG